jgi:hypothetical protein
MKKIKILLSVAGFALTSICFGQLLSQNNHDVLFYTAYYNAANSRFEHRLNEYPGRTASGDQLEAPIITRTFFVPVENEMAIESWMTAPFETNYYEEEILLESWMLAPFESCYFEEDLKVEAWMTKSWM